MGVLRVEEARAGLVSAAEVRDRTGRLLLTAGEQITDRALRVLRMWGVEEIDVEGAVDPPGPPVGHLTSAVFEGDRKRLEAQFHLSEKMEAIGRLAGGIAHDFNNLLMVVRGYVDLVASRLETGVPLNGEIDQIRRATDSALSLTCQLLTFARRPVLQPRVLDLNDLVADLGPMLRRLIGEDIDLATALRARPGLVKADPAQIEQVVTNLAASARDAMPSGGRLRIETANVARGPGGEPHVLLVVSDSGPGMDTATQSRLFEPVFTAKETGKGTGLRLATVYGIVRQHQGTIDVDSEPGQGTTFRIGLPAANGASEASVTGVE